MANIIKHKSDLKKKYRKFNFLLWIFAILGFVSVNFFVKYIINNQLKDRVHDPYFFFLLATMLVFFIVSGKYGEKAEKLKAGLNGEAQSEDLLSGLPDDYTVIPNLKLEVNGQKTEIDHLVIGESGVFIVETKNFKGILYGRSEDRELTKVKIGYEKEYPQTVRNPIFQVKREIAILKEYLKAKGCDHYIHGIVFYANLEFTYAVQGEDPYVTVIQAGENEVIDMHEAILSCVDKNMTAAKMDRLLECLIP